MSYELHQFSSFLHSSIAGEVDERDPIVFVDNGELLIGTTSVVSEKNQVTVTIDHDTSSLYKVEKSGDVTGVIAEDPSA